MSCVLLADAFRRLSYVKKEDEVIDKGPVILLFISFGAYGLSTLFFIPFALGSVSDGYFWFDLVFFQASYIVSCLTLSIIVYKLLTIQTAQDGEVQTDDSDIFESKTNFSVTGLQQDDDCLHTRPLTTKLPSIVEL